MLVQAYFVPVRRHLVDTWRQGNLEVILQGTQQKLDGKWTISSTDDLNGAKMLHTIKLIVASGLTSAPSLPDLLHQESLKA